jgi:hypothetical protein
LNVTVTCACLQSIIDISIVDILLYVFKEGRSTWRIEERKKGTGKQDSFLASIDKSLLIEKEHQGIN